MRASLLSPRSTSLASAPVASQAAAISLMNTTEVARNAFTACLVISADSTHHQLDVGLVVLIDGRVERDPDDVCGGDGREVGRKLQSPRVEPLTHELREPRLEDRRAALAQSRDDARVGIEPDRGEVFGD